MYSNCLYQCLRIKTNWQFVKTSLSYFSHLRLIIGFITRLTRWAPLVEQEPLTLPKHLSSPSVFSGVRVTRSLVLCVCFVDRCFFFCTFSFGHYVVCSSSIYWFWLPLWYLQTILNVIRCLFEKIQTRTLSEQFQNPI